MVENSSEILLKRYQSDSETAPFDIHERYERRLIALARAQLLGVLKAKVDPQDIAQETFQAFFELADRNEVRWQSQGDLWRLLAGIAINKVKQNFHYYAAAKRNSRCEETLESEAAVVERNGPMAARELSELVEHLLVSEKPLMKKVLAMRLAGFTFEEIGKRSGRSTRTIRRLLESLKTRIVSDRELASIFGITKRAIPDVEADQISLKAIETARYDDFQLLKMLGQGSFAKVYLAKQVSTGQFFAIKAIRKKWLDNDEVLQCFTKEIQLLMRMNDAHIVRTCGFGHLPNGGCFLVLEWIDGSSLESLVANATPEERIRWWTQLRATVHRMHSAGIVHGDLRSRNIMIDSGNNVRIVDMGLGRLFASDGIDQNVDLQALQSLGRELGCE